MFQVCPLAWGRAEDPDRRVGCQHRVPPVQVVCGGGVQEVFPQQRLLLRLLQLQADCPLRHSAERRRAVKGRVYFWTLFLVFFWSLLHTSAMSQSITQIFKASLRFSECWSWYHFNGSFSRKKILLTFWEGFLRDWGRPPKKPKGPFSSKTNLWKMTPPLRHSQNPLGPREYPWRLVTLSKCGSRARRTKINPATILVKL